MWEKVEKHIERLLNSPLFFFFGLITALTTCWGLVSIFKDLKEFFGLNVAVVSIIALVVVSVFTIFVIFAVRLFAVWKFFVPVKKTNRYLCTIIDRQWGIDAQGNGVIEQNKTYLFTRKPESEDLADIVFSSEPLSLDSLKHKSNDAVYVDHKEIKKGIHEVYWKPKIGEIEIGKPYEHHINASFPVKEFPAFKSMTIASNSHVIKFQMKVQSSIPIDEVVVFRGSRYFKIKDANSIQKKGKKVR